jgi:murein DD-endopeptidase MepM/ murein hydrolase activator NlpD
MRVRSWARLLVWPAVAAVYGAGASPAVAQSLPRFLLPGLAAVGAVVILWSFVAALARLRRGVRADRLLALLLSAAALVFLVALPITRLARVLAGSPAGEPLVLARFGDWLGSEGFPRLSAHRGIDVVGRPGSDVLAAADGRVIVARDNRDLCGLILVLVHAPHGYRTIYCHSAELAVRVGDDVRRGQRIGALGTTGQRAWPGYEHVHLELQKGPEKSGVEDPLLRMAGCFEPSARYATDRLVLTYPVRC